MGRNVAIGIQDFETLRKENLFYVDKTDFIRKWWESRDRGDLFEGLSVWEDEKYRKLQAALRQIEEKQYEASLIAKGIPAERIRKYGFAFEGKNVLIGGTSNWIEKQ